MNWRYLIFPAATAWLGYLGINHCYLSHPAKQEYKQEFQTELKTFSTTMNRKFPKNAEAKNAIELSIYVDAEFKRNHDHWLDPTDNEDWKEVLEESLEKAAQRFYEEFGLSFQVENAEYWDSKATTLLPTSALLNQLAKKESKTLGTIGLSGKKALHGALGAAEIRITYNELKLSLVAKDMRNSVLDPVIIEEAPLDILIQHEMSHWFGALDILTEEEARRKPPGYTYLPKGNEESIMEYTLETTEWDKTNKQLMKVRIPLILKHAKAQKGLKTQQK